MGGDGQSQALGQFRTLLVVGAKINLPHFVGGVVDLNGMHLAAGTVCAFNNGDIAFAHVVKFKGSG